MIESKLYQAAQLLPEPAGSFSLIEERAQRGRRKPSAGTCRYRRAVAFACVLLLLAGSVLAATTEINYSGWAVHSESLRDVERIEERLGVVLPETLGGSPFYHVTAMFVAAEGTTYWDALTSPAYRWYNISYGVQELVRSYTSEKPDSAFSETVEIHDQYSLSVGSTGDELYAYVFSLDEEGNIANENILPGSVGREACGAVVLQFATRVQYDEKGAVFVYHHSVTWVDQARSAVFHLSRSRYAGEPEAEQFPEELLPLARQLAGLNVLNR